MTCLVGLEAADGSAWLGADRYFGEAGWRDVMDQPKVVRRGPVLLGFCGGMAEGQLLERVPAPRKRRGREDVVDYLVDAVIGPLMQSTHRAGLELSDGFMGLIACAGGIYVLESDGGFWRSTRGYMAIGAASPLALGALASSDPTTAPEYRLEAALRAAERHSPYCMAPFDYLRLPR